MSISTCLPYLPDLITLFDIMNTIGFASTASVDKIVRQFCYYQYTDFLGNMGTCISINAWNAQELPMCTMSVTISVISPNDHTIVKS